MNDEYSHPAETISSTQEYEEIYDPDVCPECGSMTTLKCEIREGNYNEMVRYCHGCGATQTASQRRNYAWRLRPER